MSIPLRDYQSEALDAIEAARKRGVRRQLVSHSTGLGKTVLAAHLMHSWQPQRCLFVVHREELIRQTVDKLTMLDPDVDVGIVRGRSDETDASVVVASVATLARNNRLARLGEDFAVCVIDEAHHAAAVSYRHIVEALPDAELVLGLTATPTRGDGIGLECFDEITHSVSLLDGIEAGYLADLRGFIAGTDMDLSCVRRRGGDYTDDALGAEMTRSGASAAIVHAWSIHAADRHTLAFTPTVATAYELAEAFRAAGVAADAFDGFSSGSARRAALDAFHRRQTQVLVNCAVLTEGFDEPSVDCVLLARPTSSPLLYQQIVGRAARPHPGKTDAIVLDVTGASADHELVSLPSLAGLQKAEIEQGQPLSEAAEVAASPAGQQRRIKRATRSRAVDLLSRGNLHWITYRQALILPAGETTVLAVPGDEDGQRWTVATTAKGERPHVLGSELSAGYAAGIAEDYARSCGSLARSSGRWRRQTVTEGQRTFLRRHGGLDEDKLAAVRDRGHASDLITIIVARPALAELARKETAGVAR